MGTAEPLRKRFVPRWDMVNAAFTFTTFVGVLLTLRARFPGGKGEMPMSFRPLVPLAFAAALVAGCHSNTNEVDALDNSLVANDVDPALAGALNGQIMVDPALTQQANGAAVRPPAQPYSGETPKVAGVDQASGVAAHFRQAGSVRHDNWRSARHRFNRRKAEPLVSGRINEKARSCIKVWKKRLFNIA